MQNFSELASGDFCDSVVHDPRDPGNAVNGCDSMGHRIELSAVHLRGGHQTDMQSRVLGGTCVSEDQVSPMAGVLGAAPCWPRHLFSNGGDGLIHGFGAEWTPIHIHNFGVPPRWVKSEEAALFRRRWADGGFSVELSGAKTQFKFIAITVSEMVSPNRMDLDRRGRLVSQDGSLNKLRFVESLGAQRHFL